MIFDKINLILGATAGAVVSGLIAYNVGTWLGDKSGYARYKTEMAEAAVRAERKRNENDIEIQNSSDFDVCVRSLTSRGMPVDACEQLRGLSAGEPDTEGNGSAD